MESRLPRLIRAEPLLFALVAAAAVGYSLYSLWEHNHFLTDFDLAIFDQALWHYSRLSSPEITTIAPPINMLGDHFAPILIALSPLYWAWSDPRVLLLVQALLIAASIVPVFLFARPRLGRTGAYLLCGGYSVFWGINAAVGFQFHELAFSPLLIALCVLFADRRQWTAFFVSFAALLLVKENMSVLAVFIGIWLMVGGEVRRGAIAAGIGVAWYVLVLNVLLPAFGDGSYTHWTYTEFGDDGPSALVKILGHPDLPVRELFDDPTKRRTLALLFLPFLGLVLCSRLAILCIPLVAQQLFSSYDALWGTGFHYWLPIGTVLAMGAADGFRNLAGWLRPGRPVALAGALVAGLILCANLVLAARESWVGVPYEAQLTGVPLLAPVQHGLDLSPTAEERDRGELLDSIPESASVVAAAPVLPHLSERDEIYMLGYPAPEAEYVVFSPEFIFFPDPAYAQRWLDDHRDRYRPIKESDRWVVWERLG